MSNNYEQPVEPMSRVEDILRGDTTAVPMSRVEDLLKQLIEGGGGGSTVTVVPRLAEGVKLATINVDGTDYDIYAPEDVVGSIVTVSPILQSGTKIATITVNQTNYDIYAPEGGGSGGGNLYGTTDPTSDLGNNGDIYMKYQGGSEPVEGDWETICSTETRTTSGAVVMSNFDPTAYKKIKFYGYYATSYSASSANKSFTSSEIDVEDIPAYGETGLVIGSNYVCVTLGQDGNSLYVYPSNDGWKWAVSEIDATPLTLYPPAITDIYGKVENKWVNTRSYSETVLWSGTETISAWANPFTIPDISLSVLDNYDAFSFEAELQEGNDAYPYSGILLASYIKNNVGTYIQIPIMIAHSHQMNVYPDQTNNCFKLYAETNYGYKFKRLVGIRY